MPLRVATFNLENLFTRPRAMNLETWADGRPALEALTKFNTLIEKQTYSTADKAAMKVFIETYAVGEGRFFKLVEVREKLYAPQSKKIVADGRDNWVGWVDHLRDDVTWSATRNTAQVLDAVKPDVLVAVEAEDRITMQRFNDDVLNEEFHLSFPHNLLVDGNDERGIDIGIFSNFPIVSVRSHIKDTDASGIIFSRDCPEFEISLPNGQSLLVLGNHFKSKGFGSQASSNAKRLRQAQRTRAIYQAALQRSQFVIVAGDLNDFPTSPSIQALIQGSGMQDVMSHPTYQGKPGTFKTGNSPNQKIDYVCLSPALWATVQAVDVERRGVYAPNTHVSFPEVTSLTTQASDHAAVWTQLAL